MRLKLGSGDIQIALAVGIFLTSYGIAHAEEITPLPRRRAPPLEELPSPPPRMPPSPETVTKSAPPRMPPSPETGVRSAPPRMPPSEKPGAPPPRMPQRNEF